MSSYFVLSNGIPPIVAYQSKSTTNLSFPTQMNIVNSNMSTNTQATTQIYTGLVINVQSAKGITLQKIYLR